MTERAAEPDRILVAGVFVRRFGHRVTERAAERDRILVAGVFVRRFGHRVTEGFNTRQITLR